VRFWKNDDFFIKVEESKPRLGIQILKNPNFQILSFTLIEKKIS
jgi:hypothetical protein